MAGPQVEVSQGGQVGYGATRKHGEGRTWRDWDVWSTNTLTAGGRILEDVRDGGRLLVAQIRPGDASVACERPETASQTDAWQQRGTIGQQ
eukprot:1467947-Prymnesium_polylepis.2